MHLCRFSLRWGFLAACLLLVTDSRAQAAGNKTTPLWIRMMDDTTANYYVALQDYKAFWNGKEKPEDEEETMNQGAEMVKDHLRKRSKREMREERQMDYYRYQCKRFENWLLGNKPFVQSDGRILTEEEKLQLWKDSKKSKP